MASPIPYDYRQQIIRRRNAGQSFPLIAEQLGYSLSGVKKIWYKYKKQGASSFKTQHHKCGRKSAFDESIFESIKRIKTGNQGAPYVYSRLRSIHPEIDVPSIRTLQRWALVNGTSRSTGRPPKKEKKVGPNTHITLGK